MTNRTWAAVGAIATIAFGILARGVPYVGDALGGIAYTVLVALIIVTLRPATTPVVAGLSAYVISCGIEFLQLTDLPRTIVSHVPAARWVLGSTFNAQDLFWYAVGASIAFLLCRALGAGTGVPSW